MRRTLIWAGYAAAWAAAPLVFDSSAAITLLSQVAATVVICLSYHLLLGEGGLLSFGHAVFVGLGGYVVVHALAALNAGQVVLPVSLLPLLGGLGCGALAALLGAFITRRAGTAFAMITLGIGELFVAMAPMFPAVFGGEGGISANRVVGAPVAGISFGPQIEVYALAAVYGVLSTAALFGFTRTPLGRLLNATRDNAERVGFIGYDVRVVRTLAFTVAGFFAGVGGGLLALTFESVGVESMGGARSGAILLFTFLGGTALFVGPVIGAVLMVWALGPLSGLTHAWQVYLGLAFVAMVMFAPGGIAGLLVKPPRGVLWLALPAAVALLGGAALIEMTYHRQLEAAFGPAVAFLGLQLDTGSPAVWAAAAALTAAGALAFVAVRRRVAASP